MYRLRWAEHVTRIGKQIQTTDGLKNLFKINRGADAIILKGLTGKYFV
jgi:hypothetical protein